MSMQRDEIMNRSKTSATQSESPPAQSVIFVMSATQPVVIVKDRHRTEMTQSNSAESRPMRSYRPDYTEQAFAQSLAQEAPITASWSQRWSPWARPHMQTTATTTTSVRTGRGLTSPNYSDEDLAASPAVTDDTRQVAFSSSLFGYQVLRNVFPASSLSPSAQPARQATVFNAQERLRTRLQRRGTQNPYDLPSLLENDFETWSTATTVPNKHWKRRHSILLLGVILVVYAYILRASLSQAIVPMSQTYFWSQKTQGLALSSFFYGYIATQVLGGWCSHRFGAKHVMTASIAISAILTALIPVVSNVNGLIVLRIGTGIAQGVTFPSLTCLLAAWTPERERTAAISFLHSGTYIGIIVVQGLYPLLATLLGWQLPFYILGFLGLPVLVCWQWYVQSRPVAIEDRLDERIIVDARAETESLNKSRSLLSAALLDESQSCLSSDLENNYVSNVSPFTATPSSPIVIAAAPHSSHSIPWVPLFTRLSVWAYMINHISHNTAFYFFLSYLPKYLNSVLGFQFETAGGVAMLPYLGIWSVSVVGGQIADRLLIRGYSLWRVRCGMQTVGYLFPALILLCMGLFPSESASLTVFLMSLAIALTGASTSGHMTLPLDISAEYAGIIVSVGNTLATVPGFVMPLIAGDLLEWGQCKDSFPESGDCRTGWSFLFFGVAGMYLLGLLSMFVAASTSSLSLKEKERMSLDEESSPLLSSNTL